MADTQKSQEGIFTKVGVIIQGTLGVGAVIGLVWTASARLGAIDSREENMQRQVDYECFKKGDHDQFIWEANQRGKFPLPYAAEYQHEPDSPRKAQ